MKAVSREPACRALFLALVFLLPSACSANNKTPAPETVAIPAGDFIMGSNSSEREYAYQLDEEAYGHSRTRTAKWYDSERRRTTVSTDSYHITLTPITNQQYQTFINATGHDAPTMDRATWESYGLVHPYERTRKFGWANDQPPIDRETHPVVLISYDDAQAYADWLSEARNEKWRLPTEPEWEKAVRGVEGLIFPWGDVFDSGKLNSHDAGPFDTVPVSSGSSAGPFGLFHGAGQVFEWIQTPEAKRAWVKGGSWDDRGCGVCRPAARHSRPKTLRHILIGFRLVKTQ